MALKVTPLHALYKEFGAKTVEFGGWDMPVQFSGILQEHECVRTRVGLFDVSHMGEFECTGAEAPAFLQRMVTNDVSKIAPGRALYSPMTNPDGGTVDDVLIYAFAADRFWVIVNAGNIQKDWDWLTEHAASHQVQLRDLSAEVALLAVQGPRAVDVLTRASTPDVTQLPFYSFVQGTVYGTSALISRTGYTGEDGYELYVAAADAPDLWRRLLADNVDLGISPCGLGCRDTLRLEARLPLYGHELTADITPLEAGLARFVSFDKGDFIGRDALWRQQQGGVPRTLVGLQALERGILRAGQRVEVDGAECGIVTSGTMSPTLKQSIGLALVDASHQAIGTTLNVDIRGKLIQTEVVKTPFYRRKKG